MMSIWMFLVVIFAICMAVDFGIMRSLKSRYHSRKELLGKMTVSTLANIAWKLSLLALAAKLVMMAFA